MTDRPCIVCAKPIERGTRVPSGEDVHSACDRRSKARETSPAPCVVCNEPITSQDGTAKLGDVLVHGTCFVRARKPEQKTVVSAPRPTGPGGGEPPRESRWAQRLLRRVFLRG
jgi:hypothetical protein